MAQALVLTALVAIGTVCLAMQHSAVNTIMHHLQRLMALKILDSKLQKNVAPVVSQILQFMTIFITKLNQNRLVS